MGFQCYSKLSVILMISLRGRDRKMNRFSLSFPHNCKWASERDRVREAVHIDVCIRRGFDWANIITRSEIKTVNESLFHSVSPSSLSSSSSYSVPSLWWFLIYFISLVCPHPPPHPRLPKNAICVKIALLYGNRYVMIAERSYTFSVWISLLVGQGVS